MRQQKMIKKTLKKLLPNSFIDGIQRGRNRIDIWIATKAAAYRWTAVLYYVFYNAAFYREMSLVLKGRRKYHQERGGDISKSYLLRRNIHRLEKGLIMRPRRAIFGETYIAETVKYFILCTEFKILEEAELDWTICVMSEYFSVVNRTPLIEKAFEEFDRSSALEKKQLMKSKPFQYESLPPVPVKFDEFKLLCERRHSVRWFKQLSVPRDLLEAAVDVAMTAPSACNRQPLEFHIFDDPVRAAEIGAIPMGTAGFSHNFQCIVVIVGDLSAYPYEKDRHIIYIDSALAAMQFQLALETLGLASCTINWPDIERHERQMAQELHLESFQRPTLLIAVGFAEEESMVAFSAKKTSQELTKIK